MLGLGHPFDLSFDFTLYIAALHTNYPFVERVAHSRVEHRRIGHLLHDVDACSYHPPPQARIYIGDELSRLTAALWTLEPRDFWVSHGNFTAV
jgi:hypothetical protein